MFFWTLHSSKKPEKKYLAANQNIRMISEASCDWINDAKKVQLWNHRNKLHFKIYSNRKQLSYILKMLLYLLNIGSNTCLFSFFDAVRFTVYMFCINGNIVYYSWNICRVCSSVGNAAASPDSCGQRAGLLLSASRPCSGGSALQPLRSRRPELQTRFSAQTLPSSLP